MACRGRLTSLMGVPLLRRSSIRAISIPSRYPGTRRWPARANVGGSYLTGCEFCKSSSLLEIAEESCFMPGQCSENARAKKTLRSPVFYARLWPGDLRIFLATRLSYAAVAFFGGHDEKLL